MAHAGTAHRYSKRLIAFEHSPSTNTSSNDALNTILYIGGLTDGLLTIPYPTTIAATLPPSWVLAELLLSSSYKGWGVSSLARDARELGECVQYFKNLRPGKKVVLLGHSTGCQDIMEYLVGKDSEKRPGIDGAILQGGVSDREAWADMLTEGEEKDAYNAIIEKAEEMLNEGKGKEVMEAHMVSKELGAPMTAYRTYSLLAPGADDDYFSTDLCDNHLATTFGSIPKSTPVCFLLGDEDPFVPASVDKAALLKRWTRIIREGGGVVDDEDGGLIPGGHHAFDTDPEEVVQDLVKRVCGFVVGLEKNNQWGSAGSRL
ncbi:hypothetical protein N0V83_001569 [Neocucurbitaria cava]|uniref:DUF1749-domain-containing protein n=1 Tax=Neocucurbitaria cava TaxID=798079 RepID=A0A9W8YF48_9PLEO|nr:hypothetical protein N0V83_001569 [Neocucurbitaria cava]